MARVCLTLVWLSIFLSPGFGASAEPSPLVGRTIEPFSLNDTAGKTWNFASTAGRKGVVILFVGTECPVNNLYMPRLAELAGTYEPKGIAFVAINSNAQDNPAQVAQHARTHKVTFPVLKDPDGHIADRLGARRTPEAFLLDAQRRIVYHGRIDDQYGVGYSRPQPTRRDLAEALDQLLSGSPVSVAATTAPGCLIARRPKPRIDAKVTFTREVSRLLQAHCQECHRPGQIGPMTLRTYEETSAWAETIREVIQERRMPPWHANPNHGRFANDRSLPAKDRDTLLAWIDAGCPKGDDKEMPPPRTFPDGWRSGTPDAVFTMPRAFTVPAKAANGIRYQNFVVPTNFEEDKWIERAEARPGNLAVVHHIIVYVLRPGERRGGPDGIGNGLLATFAPGDLPSIFSPGSAKKVPKGASLVFQMHYTPNGTEQTDQSSVGLTFAKTPPTHEVRTKAITQQRFLIPPGAENHKVTSTWTLSNPIQLYGFLPHMHLRGKSFEYKLTLPDGKEETLLSVPHYDFSWQSTYRLAEPRLLPAGARIDCTAIFDNSSRNLNNPDPKRWVFWGEQTWEEMMIGFADYSVIAK